MSNILLIEDSSIWRTEILMQLEKIEFNHVLACKTLNEAIQCLTNNKIDLIISDIQLNDTTIFELFKKYPHYAKIPFLFITVSENIENYIPSKQAVNSSYLIKPFHYLSLKSAIEGLLLPLEDTKSEFSNSIKIKDRYGIDLNINSNQVLLIKSELAYCKIKTTNNQFTIISNMKKICAELGPDIIQIHKTYAINKNQITKVDFKSKTVYTSLGEFPIGRVFKKEIANYLSSSQDI